MHWTKLKNLTNSKEAVKNKEKLIHHLIMEQLKTLKHGYNQTTKEGIIATIKHNGVE